MITSADIMKIKGFAYHDGTRYHCQNIECWTKHSTLKEIERSNHGMTYTPILKCSECGALYFGLETRDLEAEKIIQEYHEQRERAEEERKQNAITLAEMDAEAFYDEEKRREQEQREAVEEHESELAGDLTIPNIIGEPQKRNNRNDDEGDIILPYILTA